MRDRYFAQGDHTGVGSRVMVMSIGLFSVIVLLVGFDITADYRAGTEANHVLTESGVMAVALVGMGILLRQFRNIQRRAEQLSVDLEASRAEAERFRQEAGEALRGLGESIDRQFRRWNLSPAESEVALLLLKGLTHREIAELRSTTETTIRQQGLAVYRKSGLRSRADLSAFFLEDLLLPAHPR